MLVSLYRIIIISFLIHFWGGNFLCFPQNLLRVRKNIDTLCSPLMQGRGYVGRGDKIAANFLKHEFQKIGLKSFEEDYFQFFKLDINTFPNRMHLRINRHKLINGADFIVNCISQKGRGKARIIPLDTTIFGEIKYQQRFLEQKIKNKILLLQPQDIARIVELPQKVIDKIYSAKALIELKNNKLTASLSTRQLSHPIFEIGKTTYDSLFKFSKKKSLPKAKYRVDAVLQKNYITQNLIGYIEGTLKKDSFIVFSAHYDHLGTHGRKVYFPGANDNASGVAMLLELAHHYAQNPPQYSIVLMAFGAEEAGLLGSKYYTENPLFDLERIRFLINVDLVGTGDEGITVVNGAVFKKQFDLLVRLNQQNNYLPKVNPRGFAANSDHYYFTEKKVKSFFIYTLGGIRAYHDIYDKSDTLPLTRFEGVFQLIKDFIGQIP